MAESILGSSLEFLSRIGIFEVVLPFMLVFTIVFAILEKTRVFGTEKIGGKDVSRKSQNSMVAFVVGFFVIASTQLVGVINQVMSQMVLLLLLSISFLILVGALQGEQTTSFALTGPYKYLFEGLMFVGIILIFMNALGWLQKTFDFLERNWNNDWVMSLFLVIIVVVIMAYVTGGIKTPTKKKEES